jgi:RNA polymerase-binding transcription factor DksA
MSRIEAEAREILLRRRRSLSLGTPHSAADPAARWADYEAMPAPISDGVRREIADIDAALARIQAGSYGRCLNCGGPLGLQRLRAIPEARYCLACSGHVNVID